MIQAAHIGKKYDIFCSFCQLMLLTFLGCGIYGNEGMRAVQSSDFAFG